MNSVRLNALQALIRFLPPRRSAAYCASCAIILFLVQMSASSASADELFALGGVVRDWNADMNSSSYSWQLEFRKKLGNHVLASFTYLNEGHLPAHHRDGNALQLWATNDILNRHLSLAAGIGPYYYYDTITGATGGTHRNTHGLGAVASLATVLHTGTPWLFQVRANWVTTFDKLDTVSVLAGIGYQLDKPEQPPLSGAPQSQPEMTTANEVTLFAGRTLTNSSAPDHSGSVSIEYRRGLLRNLDWSVAWLYEGNNRLISRHGLTSQLWAVKAFLNNRMTLGAGVGIYFALDKLARQRQDGDHVISAIGTLTASYRLDPRWSLRISWNRIVTNYDRDTDVLLGGVGYGF